MKAVRLKGPGEIVLEEVPIPEISDDEVTVEVKYCGICGTDVHAVKDGESYAPGTYMGHEFSGLLVKVGKNVKGWKRGVGVVVNLMYMCGKCYGGKHGCQSICELAFARATGGLITLAGAFAMFVGVAIPEWRLYVLPGEVSFGDGAQVEPLAGLLHAIRILRFRAREHAMVLITRRRKA